MASVILSSIMTHYTSWIYPRMLQHLQKFISIDQ